MDGKEKAKKSADAIGTIADFVSKNLSYKYTSKHLKVVLNVPLKQLEDELKNLKAFIDTLK